MTDPPQPLPTSPTPSSDPTPSSTPAPSSTTQTGSIKIFVRVRPPRSNSKLHTTPGRYYTHNPSNPTSTSENSDDPDAFPKIGFRIPKDEKEGIVNNSRETWDYRFHRVFDKDSTQEEVFDVVAKDVVLSVMDGYNGTIFAYGQTGSGKTFTITGGAERYADRGLIPRTLQFIFREASKRQGWSCEVQVSYLEIYNETGYDLLTPARENTPATKLEDLPKVRLQEDAEQNIHLSNLGLHKATTEEEALNLLFLGDTNRMIAETPSNPASSRSHCIFIIHLTTRLENSSTIRRSKLHLVDLAGSERTSKTGINGQLFKEASYINLSLHYLEQVIIALHEKSLQKRSHIPYRNSMMTSVLRDSLGGNCMTTMIATVAPEDELIEESISTCRFAQRVALIQNKAVLNEEQDPYAVIARLKKEILRLKAELAIARGEEGDGGELPEYEKARIRQAVEAYVKGEGELVFGDFRKIEEAFRVLKEFVLQGHRGNNSAVPSTTTPSISSIASNDPQLSKELDKLRALVTHRDNEINVLLGMINQYKSLHGALPSTARQSSTSSLSSSSTLLNTSTPRQSLSSSIPTPTLEKEKPTIPTFTPTKAKAFEEFKKGYPGSSFLDTQKEVLKGKYTEAKKMGERAATLRSQVKHLKDLLSAPVADSLSDDERKDEEKKREGWKRELQEGVKGYKEAYEGLKEMKGEVEHLQHLLEQGRLRMQRDFEGWYETVYLHGGERSESGGKLVGEEEGEDSREVGSVKELERVIMLKDTRTDVNSSTSTLYLPADNPPTSSTPPQNKSTTAWSPSSSTVYASTNSTTSSIPTSKSLYTLTPRNTSSPRPPTPTATTTKLSSKVSADVEAFYKARNSLAESLSSASSSTRPLTPSSSTMGIPTLPREKGGSLPKNVPGFVGRLMGDFGKGR
ncbi:Kinesin- protein 6 [Chytridiales sp. JEL 0842]|nr:Kinesin- protein 6 [Chytridiales sp. JEL 0842]